MNEPGGRNIRLAARAAVAALALLGAGCATSTSMEQRMLATQRLEQVWAAENRMTRAELASRIVDGTPAQAHRAAVETMGRIGLVVDDSRSQPPRVVAESTFADGGWSWNEQVRLSEEPRMRQVFVQAIGPSGARLVMAPGEEVLTVTAVTGSSTRDGTEIAVDFVSTSPNVDCVQQACVGEMAPMALRAGYYEFWRAFDEELTAIRDFDRAEAEAAARRARSQRPPRSRARPVQPQRPPRDWTPPPSGWRPPPRG
ncbi:hypothetical protein [Brevundimonas sp.]|uniref:hypothetical protein n=1 Tax=Brevundimonas sp. TaxID=1871086 RepID=UPI002EDBA832